MCSSPCASCAPAAAACVCAPSSIASHSAGLLSVCLTGSPTPELLQHLRPLLHVLLLANCSLLAPWVGQQPVQHEASSPPCLPPPLKHFLTTPSLTRDATSARPPQTRTATGPSPSACQVQTPCVEFTLSKHLVLVYPHTTKHSLEAVTQHQQQWQALALLVGTRGGLGGLQTHARSTHTHTGKTLGCVDTTTNSCCLLNTAPRERTPTTRRCCCGHGAVVPRSAAQASLQPADRQPPLLGHPQSPDAGLLLPGRRSGCHQSSRSAQPSMLSACCHVGSCLLLWSC